MVYRFTKGILWSFLWTTLLFQATLFAGPGDKNAVSEPAGTCNIQIAFEYSVEALKVDFTNVSLGFYDILLWDFGDNKQSREINPTHEYSQEGTYTFCLTAVNSERDCEERFCGEVYVFK